MKDRWPLQKFWMSFLEMVELLLNTIYAIRAGYWELLLECIRNILPYTFAYGNINYARYLSAMLGDMLELSNDFPEVWFLFTYFYFDVGWVLVYTNLNSTKKC